MDKDTVAELAKSFTLSCKQVVEDNQLTQKITSPVVTLIALNVLGVVVNGFNDEKFIGWIAG